VAVTTTTQVNETVVALVIAAYAAVGLVIFWQRPRHPIGRLLLVSAVVWGVGEGLLAVGVRLLLEDPRDRLAAVSAALGATGRAVGWLLLVLWLPLWFPDGRPAGSPRLGRSTRRLAAATIGVFLAVSLFSPRLTDLRVDEIDNPIGLPQSATAIADAAAAGALLLAVVCVVLAVVNLVHRWRHDTELVRQKVLWFAVAFAPPVVLFVLSMGDIAKPWMFGVASVPVPLAIAVAIRQHRLYDLQLAVSRSLAFACLWLAIAALYAVTVGGVGAALQRRGATWLPWVAAGVVAVSFAPLRDALQQAANKLMYGQWARPAEVLAGVGRRLVDATDVGGLLETLTRQLGEGLGLTAVQIVDGDGTVLAQYGQPVEPSDERTLTAYGTPVGRLVWNRRPLRRTDLSLLDDVAHQLGGVVHGATLLHLVRASQERLVLAREEERKRLRRDLHDGLGPALAGLTLQVDTLRNRPSADGLLALRDGIQATVVDVRRIVEGLRPPALDELGLAEALHQLGGRLARDGHRVVDVSVAALPPLSAAVEVAAYRIAQEALTNAVRHSGAGQCTVALTVECGWLGVRVADDGHGRVVPRDGGIGLQTMRERAEEIGGRLEIGGADAGGTVVTALLPLAQQVAR
jgi:signal transduction histidine kinase